MANAAERSLHNRPETSIDPADRNHHRAAQEGIGVCEKALSKKDRIGRKDIQLILHMMAGCAYGDAGQLSVAIEQLKTAVKLAQEIGDWRMQKRVQGFLDPFVDRLGS